MGRRISIEANLQIALIIVLIHIWLWLLILHTNIIFNLCVNHFLSMLDPSSSILCLFQTWEKQERKRYHHLLHVSFSGCPKANDFPSVIDSSA